jgi:predicted MPP superfamily phosphohydrolase
MEPLQKPLCTRREFLIRSALAATAVYSIAVEPNMPRVERVYVPIPDLPPAFDGFTILQLCDIHLGPYVTEGKMRHGFALASSLQYDLLALVGDYITQFPENAFRVMKAVREYFSPPAGIVAVYGNHEYWTDRAIVTAALKKYDIPILLNEHRVIERGASAIYILGVDDFWEGQPDPEKAAAGTPPDAVRILLCHEPDFADIAKWYGIRLQLSGHSHGGQIRIPFTRIAYYPPFARNYPVGLQKVRTNDLPQHYPANNENRPYSPPEMWVYTSRGLGNSLPIRFACPPEITLITLRRTVSSLS